MPNHPLTLAVCILVSFQAVAPASALSRSKDCIAGPHDSSRIRRLPGAPRVHSQAA